MQRMRGRREFGGVTVPGVMREASAAAGAETIGSASTPPFGKVLVLVTEDWFALSHFKPLIRRLRRLAREVVIVARSSGRMGEIETLGARTIDLDYNRSSMNPLREAATVRSLRRVFASERPDVVHLVAMKPIVLGGLASLLAPVPHVVVHMTGLGFLAISDTAKARVARRVALGIIARVVTRRSSLLLVENPEDLAFLEAGGVRHDGRIAMLGGAGIDPGEFAPADRGHVAVPVAAFVGRMIKSKGVEVLMQAARIAEAEGVALAVDLYGEYDQGNPETLVPADVEAWQNGSTRRYRGFTRDVAAVWRTSDIFVLPALSREGMPRALLESAAAERPLVVTDVPGCRHFVRDGVEGFIVPPGDARALADALSRLARDQDLRTRLGRAARAKVLAGYTEAAVEQAVEVAYRAMAGRGGTTT
jgi:glycosyltransferase involved in cell wall biosynthesis